VYLKILFKKLNKYFLIFLIFYGGKSTYFLGSECVMLCYLNRTNCCDNTIVIDCIPSLPIENIMLSVDVSEIWLALVYLLTGEPSASFHSL